MIDDPFQVTTNKYSFSKSTGRDEADVFSDKAIVPNNLQGTPGKGQHDTHFYGATKALYFLFGSEKCFLAYSWTGKYDTENEKNMRLFKRRLLEIH